MNNYKIQPLETFVEIFLLDCDIRQSSKDTYARQLKGFLEWIDEKQYANITRETVLQYKEYLTSDRHLSSHTIGNYLHAVRRFFDWLDANELHKNIARGIKGPVRTRGFNKDVLTIDQVKELLGSINRIDLKGKRDFALINLMVRTGLRTIEITRTLREDIQKKAGESVLFVHGKGRDSKDEIVLLTPATLKPILDYLEARSSIKDEDRGLLFFPRIKNKKPFILPPIKNKDPLFASHCSINFGKELTTRSVSRIVKTRLREIALDDPRLTAHSLRHTAVTLSLLAGATLQETQIMARHNDINTTLIYAHNIDRLKRAPEKKIDKILE